ncbi:hypothetical protein [Chitinophaga caseinilytica]|uniref:TonB-dependent receptor n=1 Tax=Chitinophaga caseinilytica TaxID=2267521 RepID=A0ABZ2Z6S1_9BACT
MKYSPVESWSLRLQMLQALKRDRFKPGANGKYAYAQGPVNSFAIFSLYSNLKLDNHSGLSLGVDNLFNKDYYTVTSQWNARNENYIKGNGVRLNLQYTYDF